MKSYTMSMAASLTHTPANPERTAKRSGSGMNFDVTFQVWPNRASMLKTIELQGRGVVSRPWRACLPNCPTCMSLEHHEWCPRHTA